MNSGILLRTGVVEDCDDHGDHHRPEEQPASDARDPTTAHPNEGQHHERPDDVELLFDRKAPEVAERSEIGAGAVAGPDPDLIPVRDVGGAGDDIAAELAERVGLEQRDPHREQEHHHEQRRKEPPESSDPEVLEVDRAGAFVLGDQQQRDQVARDHEEDLDAEVTPAEPGAVGVVHHHGHDCDRPQSVEARADTGVD